MPSEELPGEEAPIEERPQVEVTGRPSLMHEARQPAAEQLWRVGQTIFRIGRLDEEHGEIELVHFESKEAKFITIDEFRNLRPGVDITYVPTPQTSEEMVDLLARDDATRSMIRKLPTDGRSFAQLAQMTIILNWIRVLTLENYLPVRACELWEPDIEKMARQHGLPVVGAETLTKWANRGALDAACIPQYDKRGGRGQSRIDARAADVLGATIDETRAGKTKIKLTTIDVSTETNSRIRALNAASAEGRPILEPSASTVGRILKQSISPYELAVARFGPLQAERMFTPSSRRPRMDFVNGMFEFDDLDTKTYLICHVSGLPWGRGLLTLGVDQKSCFPVGASLDDKARSSTTAIDAVVNSIECKRVEDFVDGKHDLTWEAQGYPAGMLFDNALWNNERFVTLNADVADVSYARPFYPKEKREIEYLNNQIVHGFLDHQPGFRGPLDDPDGIKQGLKTAVLSMQLFRTRFFTWLLGVYANRPMDDGLSPRQKYLEEGEIKFRSLVPPDTRRLRLLRTIPFDEQLTWGRGGIRTMGLTYQCEEQFKKWINRAGGSMKVDPRIDAKDLSKLYISIPDSDFVLIIPCLEADYVVGLTLYQQKLILKMCRQLKKSNPSLADMYAARRALAAMTAQMVTSGKIRERRAAYRTGDVSTTADTEAVHEVELAMDQLMLVELSASAEPWTMPTAH